MAAKDARKSAEPTVHLSGGLALCSYMGNWSRQVETHAGNRCNTVYREFRLGIYCVHACLDRCDRCQGWIVGEEGGQGSDEKGV